MSSAELISELRLKETNSRNPEYKIAYSQSITSGHAERSIHCWIYMSSYHISSFPTSSAVTLALVWPVRWGIAYLKSNTEVFIVRRVPVNLFFTKGLSFSFFNFYFVLHFLIFWFVFGFFLKPKQHFQNRFPYTVREGIKAFPDLFFLKEIFFTETIFKREMWIRRTLVI